MRRRPLPSPAARGFALAEALVAVAVVALIGGLSLAAFGNGDRGRVAAEAGRVALVLSQARLQAAEAGRPVAVSWNPEDRLLTAGARSVRIRRGIDGPDAAVATAIRPNGANGGLELRLAAGRHERTVTLAWLDGRVEVLR